MAVVVCVNTPCTEYNVPKDMGSVVLRPDESITCGGWVGSGDDRAPCGQPCENVPEPEPKT